MSRRSLLATAAIAPVLALALVLLHTGATAAPPCVTLDYVAQLRQADAALSAAPADPAAALTLLEAASRDAPAAAVVLDPIRTDLAASPPTIADATHRLDVLTTALALPSGSACTVDSTAARNLLHDVFASRVFAALDQNQQSSLLSTIGQMVGRVLTALFGALGSGGSVGLGALVLAAVIALVVFRVRGGLAGARARPVDEPATEGDDPGDEWRLAEAAAERGDHREAIRRAFRSALLEVAERVHVESAWTTRELLRSLEVDAGLAAVLAPAAAVFDRCWYGRAPVTAADWTLARERCLAVRAVARGAARRAG